jgi:chemotaxis protein MotB
MLAPHDVPEATTVVVPRRKKLVRRFAAALGFVALGAAGAGVAAYPALEGARARAAAAEESSARALTSVRILEDERAALRAQIERHARENAELLALKTKLASDVAARDAELQNESAARQALEEKLKAEIDSGDVSLSEDGGRLRVDLVDKVLFDSGEATITKRGAEVLARVGGILSGVQGRVVLVSGHTDDSPPAGKLVEQFPTNWELSTARATNVVRFLQDTSAIPGKRLQAAGFGQYRPVTTNANHAGRAKNRRIEILLVPEIEAVRSAQATRR